MPRKTNPGGVLAPSEVVGRDALIERIWEALRTQGVILTAERRIGKTSVVKKMLAEPRPGWKPVFLELERVHSAREFTIEILAAVREFLSQRNKVATKAAELFEKLGGTVIGGVLKLPESKSLDWKSLLIRTIEDLVREQREGPRLVLFFDEMPYMLDSIRRNDGEETAFAVLDVLRSLRMTCPDFRMVVTGSIGLHHVLGRLREAAYSNQPFSDMYRIEVPPLEIEAASALARDLLEGDGVSCPDPASAGKAVAVGVGGFPFYVQALVRHLMNQKVTADPESIDKTIVGQLVDANDPWRLRHFRDRIRTYYPGEEKPVQAVLDELATPDGTATFPELLQVVKGTRDIDPDRLRDLLGLMEQDHYLVRGVDNRYRFKYALIQRWWALDRGL